jgi:hypothetical protein
MWKFRDRKPMFMAFQGLQTFWFARCQGFTTCRESYQCCAGEWIGVSSAFSQPGDLLPVPERYVPPEFGQWGVAVNAWVTASSIKIDDGSLCVATKFMLPTVGVLLLNLFVHPHSPRRVTCTCAEARYTFHVRQCCDISTVWPWQHYVRGGCMKCPCSRLFLEDF